MKLYLSIALLFTLLLCGGLVSAADPDIDCHRGRATYYTWNDRGACGFSYGSTINTKMIAALNEKFYDYASHCGECYELVGAVKSPQKIMVADLCPVSGNEAVCSGDIEHFDMGSEAFPFIAESNWGVTALNFRLTNCDSSVGVTGNVKVEVVANSNYWWLGLLVFNHRTGVESVEMQLEGNWIHLERQNHNHWIRQGDSLESALAAGGIPLRVTSKWGDEVTGTLTEISDNFVVTMSQQFNAFTEESTCLVPLPWEWIYKDGLDDTKGYGWSDWSSSVPKEMCDYRAGNGDSIKTISGVMEPYAGWQLGRSWTIQNNWFDTLSFDIRSPSSNPSLLIRLNQTDVTLTSTNITSNWETVTLNLRSSFGITPGTTFNRIYIQNMNGGGNLELYLDNIRLHTNSAYIGNHYVVSGDAGGDYTSCHSGASSVVAKLAFSFCLICCGFMFQLNMY